LDFCIEVGDSGDGLTRCGAVGGVRPALNYKAATPVSKTLIKLHKTTSKE